MGQAGQRAAGRETVIAAFTIRLRQHDLVIRVREVYWPASTR